MEKKEKLKGIFICVPLKMLRDDKGILRRCETLCVKEGNWIREGVKELVQYKLYHAMTENLPRPSKIAVN